MTRVTRRSRSPPTRGKNTKATGKYERFLEVYTNHHRQPKKYRVKRVEISMRNILRHGKLRKINLFFGDYSKQKHRYQQWWRGQGECPVLGRRAFFLKI